MEEVTIPLVGVPNQRGDAFDALTAGEDQRFINCTFSVVKNPVTGEAKVYVEKRPGWGTGLVVSASGRRCQWATTGNNSAFPLFAMSDGVIYAPGVTVGSMSGVTGSTFATVNPSGSSKYFTVLYNGDIYYVDNNPTSRSYTGDTTNTSAVVTNVSSTSSLYSGMPVTGTGIPANTRILTVDSASQITLNAAATATNAGVSFTSTALALVLDADVLDSYTGAQLDGFLFSSSLSTSTYQGRIQNSNLNSITAFNASDYLSTNESFGYLVYINRTKDFVVALTTKSISFYKNSGNPFGSPLSRVDELTIDGIGAYVVASSRYGWAATALNGSIYFVSNPDNGAIGVYKITGTQVEKVSAPNVDAVLSISESANYTVNGFSFGGYDYILINCFSGTTPSSHSFSFIYQIQTGIWSEWSGDLHTFVFNQANNFVNTVYAASIVSTAGRYWRLPTSGADYTYLDEGAAYTMTIQTSKTDFGTDDLKSVWEVALIGSDIQSSGTATLEYSDDDYATWTTAGTFDLTKINPRISRVSAFRGGRAWRLTHSANTAFRAQALKFKFSRGAH